MKKYTLYMVAPLKLMELKSDLQNISSHNGESIFLEVVGVASDIKGFGQWIDAVATVENAEQAPDYILMFDVSEMAINQTQAYIDMLAPIKSARLKLKSKVVIILPAEKENDLGLINELIKLNAQNFYFVDDFNIQDIATWLFDINKTLADNQAYISSDHLNRQPSKKHEVVTQIKTEVVVKEVIVKPSDYKKSILITGRNKKGVTTVADILAMIFSDMKIKTCIVDLANNGIFMNKYWIEDQEYKGDVRIKKCRRNYDIFNVPIKDKGVIPQILNDYDIVIFDAREIMHFEVCKMVINDIILIHDMDQDEFCIAQLIKHFMIRSEKIKLIFNKYMNIGIPIQGLKEMLINLKEDEELPQNIINELETYTISFSRELMEEKIKSNYTGREIKIPEDIYNEIAYVANKIYQFELPSINGRQKSGKLIDLFNKRKTK